MTLREQIEDVLRGELDVIPPAPEDDLIASGLVDSLGIARVLVEIERRLVVEIPLAEVVLEDVRTLASLEALVARAHHGTVSAGDDVVVRVSPGIGRPVVIAHDSSLDPSGTVLLAGSLEATRPIDVLSARRDEHGRFVDRSVPEMARTYVAALRTVRSGPFTLVGYSFGGLVAFEMACLLRDAGETVEQLVLVDPQAHPAALPPHRRVAFAGRLGLRYLALFLTGARTPGGVIRTARRRVRARLASRSGHLPSDGRAPADGGGQENAIALAEHAEDVYRPKPYPGDAVLLLAEERPPSKCDPRLVWSYWVRGELTVIGVPGHHVELASRDVAGTALALRRVLAA